MPRRSRAFALPSAPDHVALLGPTNTGKTHTAIERMLRHSTGMIGLPLRLLAREVYDRVTAQVGEAAVALVTGEERRIPQRPRYWVCTVEAMPLGGAPSADPLSRVPEVDFVAVDEIQLAADPSRGHVFTSRILHARGRYETLLLGSDTMAPLLERMVPGVRIEGRPRLSKLSFAGHRSLRGLPRRSAIVAFSADRVYALAERVRARHGGAAVVLGALSPRTRNAQVAMFQAGEVPMLVATDAVGMGLNMDVTHLAFAELQKFDGARVRGLSPGEAGQIAGRAGRHLADGTFGTTDESAEMPAELARAVEEQRFPPVRRVWWRSDDLGLESIAELRASLTAPPPLPWLERAAPDEDEQALAVLAATPAIAARAASPDRVELLWEVCRIPDFRKLLTDAHTDLLARLYVRLVDHGTLSGDWVARQVDHLDRIDGDVDALTTRLSFIRTWSYIGHRSGWLDAPQALQARTREVEDRLSDALHARLTERFVDRRTLVLMGGDTGRLHGDRVHIGGVEVARLDGLTLRGLDTVPGRVRDLVGSELAARVEALVDDGGDAFSVDDTLVVRWRGAPLGRMEAGPDIREPVVRLARNELLGAGARTRVERRVAAWSRDFVAGILAPLRPEDAPRGRVRGLLYSLERGLGNTPTAEVRDVVDELSPPERAALARAGVRLGVQFVYSLPMLERTRDRAVLYAVRAGLPALPPLPSGPCAKLDPTLPREAWELLGYVPLGPRVFRIDAWESLQARLRALTRAGAFTTPPELLELAGGDASAVMMAQGYRETEGRWVAPPRGPRRP